MKRTFLGAAGLAMMLALAGCSSTPAASSTQESTSASEEVKSTVEETSSTAEEVSTVNVDNVKNALTNAGFSIENESIDGSTWTADVLSDNGTVQVSVIKTAKADVARAEYKDGLDQLQHDGYLQVNTYSAPSREMTVLLNDVNTTYGIVGVDDTDNEVIVMQNILEANESLCLDAMRTLGYTTTD